MQKSKNLALRQALNYCIGYKEKQFREILEKLSSDYSEDIGYQKLILLQLIGEIYGQHTLTGLLSSVGINPCQSNKKWQNWAISSSGLGLKNVLEMNSRQILKNY